MSKKKAKTKGKNEKRLMSKKKAKTKGKK